ncbi:hypothetical protein ACOTF3_04285 [Achromobacter xylosoxidans]
MNTAAPKTSPDAALGNLMAAALDVPAPADPPEVPAWAPDNALARTGSTEKEQAMWFAGMEQAQANAQDNAAIRAQAQEYGSPAEVAQRVEQYIGRYGREDSATLLLYEAMNALRRPAPAAPAAGDSQDLTLAQKYEDACILANANARDAARYRWLCDKFGITKLPCAIERIIDGSYVADGKKSIDAAIDAAIAAQRQGDA